MQKEIWKLAVRLVKNKNQIIGRDGKYFITLQQLAGILEIVKK
jgi:tetrahydromethanopterin S-methyltransferase subunit F